MSKLDLEKVIKVLEEVLDTCDNLQGVTWDDVDSWKNTGEKVSVREHRARINRELLNLSHLLKGAEHKVMDEYWRGKGFR